MQRNNHKKVPMPHSPTPHDTIFRRHHNHKKNQSLVPHSIRDHGPDPYIVDINKASLFNNNYSTTFWTGKHHQLTLMSIPVGKDIGLEIHKDKDRFLCVTSGQGIVQMGQLKERLNIRQAVFEDHAIFVPAGTWHNITNVGTTPMKLFLICSPPHHGKGIASAV